MNLKKIFQLSVVAGLNFHVSLLAEDFQCQDPAKLDQTTNELRDILKVSKKSAEDSKFELKSISNSVSSMVTNEGGKKKAFSITPDGQLIRLVEGSDEVEIRQLPKEFMESLGTTEFSSNKTLQLEVSPETELSKELQNLLTFAQDGQTAHLDLDKVFESADPFHSNSNSKVAEAAPAPAPAPLKTESRDDQNFVPLFNDRQIAELERGVLNDLNSFKADKPFCSQVAAEHRSADRLSGSCVDDLSSIQAPGNLFENLRDLFTSGFGSVVNSVGSFASPLFNSFSQNEASSSALDSAPEVSSSSFLPDSESFGESSDASTTADGSYLDSSSQGALGSPENFDSRLSFTLKSGSEASSLISSAENNLSPPSLSDQAIMDLADGLLSQMSDKDLNLSSFDSSLPQSISVDSKVKALKALTSLSSKEIVQALESAKNKIRERITWKLREDGTLVLVKNQSVPGMKNSTSSSSQPSKASKVFEYPKDIAILRTRRRKQI